MNSLETDNPNNTEAKTGSRLGDLFNKFGLQDDEQAIINDIKGIVTDPDIGKAEGHYKVYTEAEFINLLETLGQVKVKKMLKKEIERRKIRNSERVKWEKKIDRFDSERFQSAMRAEVDKEYNDYRVDIKGSFTKINPSKPESVREGLLRGMPNGFPPPDEVYENMIGDDFHIVDFEEVGFSIDCLLSFEAIYRVLSLEQRSAIDGIHSVLTYSDIDFKQQLSVLGVKIIIEIADFCRNVKEARTRVADAIKRAEDHNVAGSVIEQFKNDFEDYKKEYNASLKKCFDKVSGYTMYTNFVQLKGSTDYVKKFDKLQADILSHVPSK